MNRDELKWLVLVMSVLGCGGQSADDAPTGPSEERMSEADKEAAEVKPSLTETPPLEAKAPEETAGNIPRVWSFEEGARDTLPRDFLSAVGKWELATVETAPSGTQVLAQRATNGSSVFNLALVSGSSYGDLDVSVQLRAISGKIDQGGGLVWRAGDPENYYVTRYNPLEDNFRVYKVEKGSRKMLKSSTVRIDRGAWHVLRITMRGDYIECFLGGTKLLDVHDSTFGEAGQIGLWTKADALTHFDELKVIPLSESEGKQ